MCCVLISPQRGADFITEHQNHKVTIAHVTAGVVYSDPLEGKFDADILSDWDGGGVTQNLIRDYIFAPNICCLMQ